MEITTNRHWREFRYEFDVPSKVLADYEYLGADERSDGWLRYRGVWYHLSDFTLTAVPGWHGQHCGSFFSAVLIRVSDDGEQYQIATAIA